MKNLNPIAAELMAEGAEFELVERDINGNRMRVFKNAPENLVVAIEKSRKFAEREFVVSDAERVTFEEFFKRVDALAGYLQTEIGIQKGQHVAVGMKNSADWMVAFTAIMKIGAVAVLLNSKVEALSMLHAVEDGDCVFLICDDRRLEMLRSEGCALPGITSGTSEQGESLKAVYDKGLSADIPDITPDDLAGLMFTSGTTGRAKAAMITHRGMVNGMMNTLLALAEAYQRVADTYGITVEELSKHLPQTVSLMVFPLFHISGLASVFLTSLINGDKLVMMERWDAKELLRLAEKEKINNVGGAPAMHLDILKALEDNTHDISSIRSISCGGQAFPPDIINALLAAFPGVVLGAGYGMTELSGAISSSNGEAFSSKPESSGQIFPMVDVKVLGEDGAELPNFQTGEIYVRGPIVMNGYYGREDATKEVLNDGWMKTGDVGYRDDEDYLFIVDRKTDMIISAGENIYCVEIEQTLVQHPKVAQLSSFGVPDERLGERLVVVASAKDDSLTSDELMDYAKTVLGGYKIPTEIVISNSAFTYNAMQKIEKMKLREKFLNAEL